jgi:hypothetical protein
MGRYCASALDKCRIRQFEIFIANKKTDCLDHEGYVAYDWWVPLCNEVQSV